MPIELTRFYTGCRLPLFFATAWLQSNGVLASRLKYRVPLSLRSRFPSIRQYWVSDLLLSAVALIA